MIKFTFFGSSEFSIHVLQAVKSAGFIPTVIVTTPDKPKGRGLVMAENVVKIWAKENGVVALDPAKLDIDFIAQLKSFACQTSIVASFGKIIPQAVLDVVPHKTLNVHPSLLPHYRGASPIQSAMIDDVKDTGVTIIRLDSEMDHGPIIAVEKTYFNEWPTYEKAEETLGIIGGKLVARILPDWIAEKLPEKIQDHAAATFTKKISKEDGLINLADISPNSSTERAYAAFRKIQAYNNWPGAYFFRESKGKEIRVKITASKWQNDKLIIEKVIPEGKKEMSFADFVRN